MAPTAHQALVLNADFRPLSYFPLSVWSWQDAVSAVVKNKVAVVAEYAAKVHSPSVTMKMPSVIALREYQKPPERVAFTRFNVFLRDRFICQYCGCSPDRLTFDHVVPRKLGGRTEWSNIVAACEPCNSAKGHMQVMAPMRKPKQPTPYELVAAQQSFPPRYLHETWLDFLYWSAELEA